MINILKSIGRGFVIIAKELFWFFFFCVFIAEVIVLLIFIWEYPATWGGVIGLPAFIFVCYVIGRKNGNK